MIRIEYNYDTKSWDILASLPQGPDNAQSNGMGGSHDVKAVAESEIFNKPNDTLIHKNAAKRAAAGDDAKRGAEDRLGRDIHNQRSEVTQPGGMGVGH